MDFTLTCSCMHAYNILGSYDLLLPWTHQGLSQRRPPLLSLHRQSAYGDALSSLVDVLQRAVHKGELQLP